MTTPWSDPVVQTFRDRLRALLAGPAVQDALEDLLDGDDEDYDARPVYRILGEQRMLAPNWPVRYGGAGAPRAAADVVSEELAVHGVPDSAYVNSVRNAGECILLAADEAQRARYLPGIARGNLGVAVLYSEPEAGSDLASLRMRAERVPGGWRLTGEKLYNVKAGFSQAAICLARTREGATKYAGLTLFLLPLEVPGVCLERVESLNPDPFYRVRFDAVDVGEDCVLGAEGSGWRLVTAALAIERTGLDYNAKAQAWLRTVLLSAEQAPVALDPVAIDHLVALRTRIAAGHALATLSSGIDTAENIDIDGTAMSKLINSELGADVATFGLEALGMGGLVSDVARPTVRLHRQCREGPGLRLSAGSTEMMLRTIAASLGL
jgi:alkylation response protein AidB-like acyl-CoA dehydrogenase